MKLLILHLSDIHFTDSQNFGDTDVEKIIAAMQQSIRDVEHVIVIVSGDLSFSGKKEECKRVSKFLYCIKRKMFERYKINDIKMAIVPGNHDIDYNKGDRGRLGLEKLEKNDNYRDALSEELEKQCQFFTLASRFKCFVSDKILDKLIYTYGDKTVSVNLINTAIFSSLDEDQGFHYIPDEYIKKLTAQTDSDFVITVMHHPHHCFSSNCKKSFEEALYSGSDMIFVGHEHYESSMKIEHEEVSVDIFAGGKLCDKGDWSGSEFHVGLLDLDSREYRSRKYEISADYSVYEETGDRTIIISKNRTNIEASGTCVRAHSLQ